MANPSCISFPDILNKLYLVLRFSAGNAAKFPTSGIPLNFSIIGGIREYTGTRFIILDTAISFIRLVSKFFKAVS